MLRVKMATWLTAVTLVLPGCGGSESGRVTGTLLKHDGSPLAAARVIARSTKTGKSAYGTTDVSGSFELREADGAGLAPGNYDVIVLEDRGDPDRRQPLTVAARYRDPAKSGLRVTVESGKSTELNLTLESP